MVVANSYSGRGFGYRGRSPAGARLPARSWPDTGGGYPGPRTAGGERQHPLPGRDRRGGVAGGVERSQRSGWHWLLWLPVLLALATPVYDRLEPRWLGVPFFYWFQLALVVVDMVVITLVYLATKRAGVR
jgi:Protein of unknown function (DUF3311)